jgi:hypothetical protein
MWACGGMLCRRGWTLREEFWLSAGELTSVQSLDDDWVVIVFTYVEILMVMITNICGKVILGMCLMYGVRDTYTTA